MISLRKWVYGSASNALRLILSVLTAMLLPPLLTRHLSQAEYSAWVLVLQLSAYVALLDGGLQTVTAKLVAEHHSRQDLDAGRRALSSSVSVLACVAGVGVAMVAVLTWLVPVLFHEMPATLISQVRLSLFMIGCSAAFALPFNPFSAVFMGLQEYGFPTVVTLVSKLLSLALLASLVLVGCNLVQLAAVIASMNVLTALAQWAGWRRYAHARIGWTPFFLDRQMSGALLRSGGVLALWTLSGLLISGLDVMIVGRYDFGNTGFYALGVSATSFMLMSVSSLFAPLLPTVSAMQTSSTPKAIGDLTIRTSRFCTLLLCCIALPLAVFAYPLLTGWVGAAYARHSVTFLRLLVLGNLIRLAGLPYSTVVIATGQQHLATVAAIGEALANAALSLWLVRRMGAVGVAWGTVAGAVVSIALHLCVSMRATRDVIALSPVRFATGALLRPLACALPVALLLPYLRQQSMVPAPWGLLVLCFTMTTVLMVAVGLTPGDRVSVARRFLQRNKGAVHV